MIASINGIDLFYTTLGKGPPLMLMHGGMGLDHTCFRPWLDPLAERMQLIYYDHRGNGRSTRLADFTGVDHVTWADDADKLRKHLSHDKIVLLGHSCGAFVAQDYARRYGDHVAGLILCCTVPALDFPDVAMANAQKRGTPEQVRQVIKTFTEPYETDDDFKRGASIILPVYFKKYDPRVGEQFVNDTRFCAAALNHSTGTWFPAFNSLAWVHEIKAPTLIIAGKDDWINPPAQGADRIHAKLPDAKLVIFEESGHFPFIEEQPRFNTIVSEWLSHLK